MGTCCTKDENGGPVTPVTTAMVIDPFSVVQSKSDIMVSPSIIFLGVYPVDTVLVYIFSMPSPEPKPNKFLVCQNVIEVLCEQYTVDIDMIMRQVDYLRKNIQEWQHLYIQQVVVQ